MPVAFAIRRIHWSDLINASPCLSPAQAGLGILDDDAWKLGREILGLLRDENCGLARDLAIDVRDPAVRIGDDRRAAGVRLLANVDVERKPAQERHVVIGAHLLAAALSENRLRVPAIRADMHAHVLDDADNGYTDLVYHLE